MSAVFWACSLVLVVVFFGYHPSEVPCQDTLIQAMQRPLMHADLSHLGVNLFSFFILSTAIEPELGVAKYALLVGFLYAATVLMDLALGGKCAIGFSSVVFALLTWNLFKNGFNAQSLLVLALVFFQPILSGQKNISYGGHAMGIAAGLLAVGGSWLYQKYQTGQKPDLFIS